MKRNLLLLLCFLLAIKTIAQQEKQSTVSYFEKNEIKTLEKKLNLNTKEQTKSFKGSAYYKEKKRTVKNIGEYFENVLPDSIYIHHPYFENKIQKVLTEIYNANPQLNKHNPHFLLNRRFTPNAASFGINVFEINLGLFTLIENEDELAFIICHELAHQQLKHLEKKIEDRNNSFNNEELERKTKALKKIDGPKTSKAIKILKKIATDLSDKSKKAEIEADSLGLIYYQKTIYSPKAPSSIIQKLGTLEERLFSHKINWKQTFGSDYKGYQNTNTMFKKRVIDTEFTIDEDSIRTHPHTNERLSKFDAFTKNNERFRYTKSSPTKDQVLAFEALINNHELVQAFYITCFLNKTYPQSNKYKEKLSEILEFVYNQKKKHNLGYHLPAFINNYSKEKIYNDIVHFLHEVELFELKEIIKHINQK